MSAFADSSALVKLYADEEGSDQVRALTALTASTVARVEVPAALWAKVRRGEASQEGVARLVARFEVDFHGGPTALARFALVDASIRTLRLAARTAAVQWLRAYDAVQLASAMAAREADPSCTAFACFDGELRAAAAANGFELIP